jgi:hypothetical protein
LVGRVFDGKGEANIVFARDGGTDETEAGKEGVDERIDETGVGEEGADAVFAETGAGIGVVLEEEKEELEEEKELKEEEELEEVGGLISIFVLSSL